MKKLLKITFTLFITTIIVLGFAMPLNPAGNWYQQFLPNIGNRQINDITFTDSLNGYIITNEISDSSFILRTTNGGDNWFLSHFDTGICSYYNVQFINQSTGFVSGYIYNGSTFRIVKTTDGGNSWFYINSAFDIVALDMYVLNQDTIWLVDASSLVGGVFRTTNGGANWEQQLNIGSSNPSNVYFYNGTTGYISYNSGSAYVRRTTNSGVNWTVNVNGEGFTDMYFADALTGYRSYGTMKKTTDGGLSWVNQALPTGGNIVLSQIESFDCINKDTIFAAGGYINTGRGIIWRTINGGNNWLYQIPDTNINIFRYYFIDFIGKNNGWVYSPVTGVHTTTGGDPVWLTAIEQISSEVPKEFMLYQNYPNPFNPKTNIKYQITKSNSNVKLVIFDITGKEIINLVDREQDAGTYHVDFSGTGYSSGVYFYKLTVTTAKEVFTDTKRMLMVK